MVSPSVVWQDAECLVCLKPPNCYSVSSASSDASVNSDGVSVADWIIEIAPECASVSHKEGESGLCHRLDFETSGLLVAAKTKLAHQHLRDQFSGHSVEKHYTCLVQGKVKEEYHFTNFLYGRYRRSSKVSVSISEVPRSTRGELFCSPLEYFPHTDSSLVSIKLVTGVRHQIRAQLAYEGFPLFGDELYGSNKKFSDTQLKFSPFEDSSRKFFLHAESVAFSHPKTGERLSFHSKCEVKELAL